MMHLADSTPDRIGPYRVCRELGSENGPLQYLAFDEGGEGAVREVILHLADPAADPTCTEACAREAAVYVALEHANVARLERVLLHEGRCLAVTEYVPSVSLGELETAGIALEDDAVLYVGAAVARALGYVHGVLCETTGRPLTHGFLHADRIRLGFDGVVRVTGFGLAALRGPGAAVAGYCGDVEQAAGVVGAWLARGKSAALGHCGSPLGAVRTDLAPDLLETLRIAMTPGAGGTTGDQLAQVLERSANLERGQRLVSEAVRRAIAARNMGTSERMHTLLGLAPFEAASNGEEETGGTFSPPAPGAPPIPTGIVGGGGAALTAAATGIAGGGGAASTADPSPRSTFASMGDPLDRGALADRDRERRRKLRTTILVAASATVALVLAGWSVRFVYDSLKSTAPPGPSGASVNASASVPSSPPSQGVDSDKIAGAAPASPMGSAGAPEAEAPSSGRRQLPPNTGQLTVHSSAASGYVYVGTSRMGRIEAPLVVPCGKKTVALGIPTRRDRPPVWLAPGKLYEIECGGTTELTIQPRSLR